ncbi:MAG: choloylglycine hydrolase family protein [Clostridia bacterium]|nr:choloylglycine hydrolase family protein [Clostridia bacterium]
MCTAVSLVRGGRHYFGRTLDTPHPYGAQAVVMPRRFPLRFSEMGAVDRHYAVIGMAAVEDGRPLLFDAANEHGLCMAALAFPGCARYFPAVPDKDNFAPHELMPWVLSQCVSAAQARAMLARVSVMDKPFSADMPNMPLHWIIADAHEAFAAESTQDGLLLTDNPVRVMTNSPALPFHLQGLRMYTALSPAQPQPRFRPGMPLGLYSLGMGALGLPGDLSSHSRFVRAAFLLHHSVCGDAPSACIRQLQHVLGCVAQPRGATLMDDGQYEYTCYASCIDAAQGVLHVSPYDGNGLALSLRDAEPDGETLVCREMA